MIGEINAPIIAALSSRKEWGYGGRLEPAQMRLERFGDLELERKDARG